MQDQNVRPTPPGPASPPVCEHGSVNFEYCPHCRERDRQVHEAIKPLVDEFWENRGRRDLNHLFFRAYRMGMRHGL